MRLWLGVANGRKCNRKILVCSICTNLQSFSLFCIFPSLGDLDGNVALGEAPRPQGSEFL